MGYILVSHCNCVSVLYLTKVITVLFMKMRSSLTEEPFACLHVSFLITEVGDHFVYQQSPLLPVSRQPRTFCHWSVWPVLDIICPSSHRPASSSLPIYSTFQYFGAQISGSDHVTKILKLASLYSWQQSFLWLYFLQHGCISPTCRPTYPQQPRLSTLVGWNIVNWSATVQRIADKACNRRMALKSHCWPRVDL